MYSGNLITQKIKNVSVGEILLVIFFCITCATALHVKHLSIRCMDNYTGDLINYVHIENNSLSNSMNSTKIQNAKPRMAPKLFARLIPET